MKRFVLAVLFVLAAVEVAAAEPTSLRFHVTGSITEIPPLSHDFATRLGVAAEDSLSLTLFVEPLSFRFDENVELLRGSLGSAPLSSIRYDVSIEPFLVTLRSRVITTNEAPAELVVEYFETGEDSRFTLTDVDGISSIVGEIRTFERLDPCEELAASNAMLLSSLMEQEALVTTLNEQVTGLETALSNVATQLESLTAHFRNSFGDLSFTIPGATSSEQLAAVVAAIRKLNHGQQLALYRYLSGKK
jgi:uncharacterized coiled-coil protein SlyX